MEEVIKVQSVQHQVLYFKIHYYNVIRNLLHTADNCILSHF